MQRSYHSWHSATLDREMELLVFGHAGAPVLVFPTSQGRFFEFEDRGMVQVLEEQVRQGWMQLICLDSIDAESWYCSWAHPSGRVQRHDQYEQYVLNEVVPFVQRTNSNDFWMTLGCSFGGYHAVNLALRHPQLFRRTLGMSGRYTMRSFMDGYSDELLHAHTPNDYAQTLHTSDQLAALRQLDIILAVGRDDPAWASNEALSTTLWSKGIGNALRVWDGWAHDWPFWASMLRLYISGPDEG